MAHEVFGVIHGRLKEAGGALAGMLAMDSGRIEKAYRHFGHDVGGDDHVLEAGLGFAVRTGKSSGRYGPFIGRDAILRKRETGLNRRLLQLRLQDPQPLLYHNELIIRNGIVTGYVTSGAYGHSLGSAVGLGYTSCQPGETDADILQSNFEVEVAGTRYAAEVSLGAMYDKRSDRMRA